MGSQLSSVTLLSSWVTASIWLYAIKIWHFVKWDRSCVLYWMEWSHVVQCLRLVVGLESVCRWQFKHAVTYKYPSISVAHIMPCCLSHFSTAFWTHGMPPGLRMPHPVVTDITRFTFVCPSSLSMWWSWNIPKAQNACMTQQFGRSLELTLFDSDVDGKIADRKLWGHGCRKYC
jgi:hypothetical protein